MWIYSWIFWKEAKLAHSGGDILKSYKVTDQRQLGQVNKGYLEEIQSARGTAARSPLPPAPCRFEIGADLLPADSSALLRPISSATDCSIHLPPSQSTSQDIKLFWFQVRNCHDYYCTLRMLLKCLHNFSILASASQERFDLFQQNLGLLNAISGNATEMIISIYALKNGIILLFSNHY